jgi:predicted Zn finger-like uncharacterized protein
MPRLSCPYCQARYMYNPDHISPDGSVTCQNCNRLMRVREDSLEALPIEDVVAKPVFNRLFLFSFAIIMLFVFIFFLLAESRLDLEWRWPPGWVTIFDF